MSSWRRMKDGKNAMVFSIAQHPLLVSHWRIIQLSLKSNNLQNTQSYRKGSTTHTGSSKVQLVDIKLTLFSSSKRYHSSSLESVSKLWIVPTEYVIIRSRSLAKTGRGPPNNFTSRKIEAVEKLIQCLLQIVEIRTKKLSNATSSMIPSCTTGPYFWCARWSSWSLTRCTWYFGVEEAKN